MSALIGRLVRNHLEPVAFVSACLIATAVFLAIANGP